MRYNISITRTDQESSSFVEGTLLNVSQMDEEERKAVIIDYMTALLERLESNE